MKGEINSTNGFEWTNAVKSIEMDSTKSNDALECDLNKFLSRVLKFNLLRVDTKYFEKRVFIFFFFKFFLLSKENIK